MLLFQPPLCQRGGRKHFAFKGRRGSDHQFPLAGYCGVYKGVEARAVIRVLGAGRGNKGGDKEGIERGGLGLTRFVCCSVPIYKGNMPPSFVPFELALYTKRRCRTIAMNLGRVCTAI